VDEAGCALMMLNHRV